MSVRAGNWPVPVGAGDTVCNLRPATKSRMFDLTRLNYLITFQPVDVNDPGTLILYDGSNTAMVTLNAGGYATFTPVASGVQYNYYFIASNGANIASIIAPYRG